jgi:hypothetical protein
MTKTIKTISPVELGNKILRVLKVGNDDDIDFSPLRDGSVRVAVRKPQP